MAYESDLDRSAFRLGPHLVTPSRNRIGCGKSAVTIAPKVMHLLCTLAVSAGETLPRQELCRRVWGCEVVSDAAIDRAVCNLRKALGDDARHPIYVETVRKRGIRLMVAAEPAKPSPPRLARRRRFAPMKAVGGLGGSALIAAAALMPTAEVADAPTADEISITQAPPAPLDVEQAVARLFEANACARARSTAPTEGWRRSLIEA